MSALKISVYNLLIILTLLGAGCSRTKSTIKTNGTYSLYLMTKDGGHAIMTLDSLASNSVTDSEQMITVPNSTFDRSIIIKDGFYYHMDGRQNSFNKYSLQTDGLQQVASIPIQDKHIENKYWIARDTLLLLTVDDRTYSKLEYYKIDSKSFRIVSSGSIPVTFPSKEFPFLSIGFNYMRDNKMFIGYSFNKTMAKNDYTTIDTMYVATLDVQTMQINNIQKDSRSTYPGGINTVQSYSFEDENKDFYFMSCPGIALGNNLKKPTAIFRIDAKTNKIDPDYMINISNKINNHAYGMWYLGNQEALIRSERKDRYHNFQDHHSTYHFEYYRVNLRNGDMVKLELPFDKGTRKESVIVQNNKAYIGIDDSTNTHSIWVYDIPTAKISKGTGLSQRVDFILRMDSL
ncbi:hypothetical protein [Sphingobacterium spiritivorum]